MVRSFRHLPAVRHEQVDGAPRQHDQQPGAKIGRQNLNAGVDWRKEGQRRRGDSSDRKSCGKDHRRWVETGGMAEHQTQGERQRQAGQPQGGDARSCLTRGRAAGNHRGPEAQALIADREKPQGKRRKRQPQPVTRTAGKADEECSDRGKDAGEGSSREAQGEADFGQAIKEVWPPAMSRGDQGEDQCSQEQETGGPQQRRTEPSDRPQISSKRGNELIRGDHVSLPPEKNSRRRRTARWVATLSAATLVPLTAEASLSDSPSILVSRTASRCPAGRRSRAAAISWIFVMSSRFAGGSAKVS